MSPLMPAWGISELGHQALIADVAEGAHVGTSDLPTRHGLRMYRDAADSLPPGERGEDNGSGEILDKLIADIAADGHVTISDLPTRNVLRMYRDAADSLPPEHRCRLRRQRRRRRLTD